MKLPAIQFYPGDWKKDPGVQALSFHDRGVWIEILFLMHESDERGVLLLNGKPMPDEALGRILGLDNQKITTAITSILDYGVASRRPEDGALYSRRMVRDEKIRQIRSEAGEKGGNPDFSRGKTNPYYKTDKQIDKQIDKQTDKQTDKQKITPSSSSSSSSSKLKTSSSEHEPFRLAELLLNLILARKPNFKKPNLQSWAKDIDRMLRLDKRTPDRVETVIRWTQQDPFWQANVLSASTLREKFDQLELKMSCSNKKSTGTRTQRSGDRCDDPNKYDAVPEEELS